MTDPKNILDSAREIMPDLLVPELKAVEVSVDSLRTEMKLSNESMREEIKFRYEALEKTISDSHERLSAMIRQSDERQERASQALADKFDGSVQIRERLATLEARMPKQ